MDHIKITFKKYKTVLTFHWGVYLNCLRVYFNFILGKMIIVSDQSQFESKTMGNFPN